MSEERQKKSKSAWKAEEDEELNKSRVFVELTEYVANAVEHDTHLFILAKLHKLYSLHTKAHTLQFHQCQSSKLVWCHSLQLAVSGLLLPRCVFLFSSLLFLTWTKGDRIEATQHLFTFIYPFICDFSIKLNCNKNTVLFFEFQ